MSASGGGDLHFHWADYLVFALGLGLSASIGVFYGLKGWRKKETTDDFLMAGRNMAVFPVSVSIFVSWMSAISFLADPVEVYYHGMVYYYILIGYVLPLPIIAHFFAPVYHKLMLTSAYEYLELRYTRGLRLLCSCLNGLTLSYLAIVLYAPALALSQVSGMPLMTSILAVGFVCTFYTTVGGMKAVLWADTIQTGIMVAGLVALAVGGVRAVGGMGNVIKAAQEGGRLNFNVFDPSPFTRSTFWTYVIGGFFRVLNPYVSTQFIVQRFCTLSRPQDARNAAYLNIPMFVILVSLFALIGMVMFAYFQHCDPLKAGRITQADQMIPLMMLEVLGFLPGLPGLFLACMFSASLSTLSSGQNALATTFVMDILQPAYKHFHDGKKPSEKFTSNAAKIMTFILGMVNILFAVLISKASGSIFQITNMATGMVFSPMCSVFVLGLLFPDVDTLSAIVGAGISLVITMTLGIASIMHGANPERLPTFTDNCTAINATMWSNETSIYHQQSQKKSQQITVQDATEVPLANGCEKTTVI